MHTRSPQHSGIPSVYQDNDPTKDMRVVDIVRAIQNLIVAGMPSTWGKRRSIAPGAKHHRAPRAARCAGPEDTGHASDAFYQGARSEAPAAAHRD